MIDPDTGTISGGSYGSTYNIEYTTNDACPSTSTLEVTTLNEDDSSFELTATCDGATANITGIQGVHLLLQMHLPMEQLLIQIPEQ